ncbi:hypothetical protein NQD34_011765 [Periophthalmus magnuspinnatus]|nr:hypothetical protein NQD34_011765 [Periophthalmus magnuspinnatus]
MNVWQDRPKPYQLFYLCPPDGHIHLAYLVKSLWRASFSHRQYGEDDYLDDYLDVTYFSYYGHPEEASLCVCPYFFDKVTENLWNYHQRQPRDVGSLNLCCFHSWSNLKEEVSRAFLSTTEEKQNGIHFSQHCRPVTRDPNRILSSSGYLLKLCKLTSNSQ